ncbi:MAG: hypothetical protein JXR03_09300 [Cyclobacteriaceae bacterium]
MNLRLKKMSAFAIGILATIIVDGQSYKVVRSRMMEAYSDTKSLAVDIDIIASHREKISFTQQAKVRVQGMDYWYKWGDTEMVANDTYTLVINHPLRSIAIGLRDAVPTNQLWQNLMSADSLLAPWIDSVEFKGKTTEGLKYHFDIGQSHLKMDLYIDPTTYLLQKIIYVENEEQGIPKIEIDYSSTRLSQYLDPELFDISRYVTIKEGKFIGVGKYSNYSLESREN